MVDLTWTDKKPSAPGFYWWKYSDDRGEVRTIVKIEQGFTYHKDHGGRDVLYVVGYGGLLEDKTGQWSSAPIAEPREL